MNFCQQRNFITYGLAKHRRAAFMLPVRKTFFTDITCSLLLWGTGLATGRKTSQASSSIKGLFFLAASRKRMQDFTVLSAVLSLGFRKKKTKPKNVCFSKNPKLQGAWFWTCVCLGVVHIYTYMLFLSQKNKVNRYYSHSILCYNLNIKIHIKYSPSSCLKTVSKMVLSSSLFFYLFHKKEAWIERKCYQSMYIYKLLLLLSAIFG